MKKMSMVAEHCNGDLWDVNLSVNKQLIYALYDNGQRTMSPGRTSKISIAQFCHSFAQYVLATKDTRLNNVTIGDENLSIRCIIGNNVEFKIIEGRENNLQEFMKLGSAEYIDFGQSNSEISIS